MSEELLQANGTVGAAALSVKGAGGGRHANRKQARKGAGFADALAALASGRKAGQAKAAGTAIAPSGAAPTPLPDDRSDTARTKASHRRPKGTDPEVAASTAVPASVEAPKSGRARTSPARPAHESGTAVAAAVHEEDASRGGAGDRADESKATAAHGKDTPRVGREGVSGESSGATALRGKEGARKTTGPWLKDADEPARAAATPTPALDPLMAAASTASAVLAPPPPASAATSGTATGTRHSARTIDPANADQATGKRQPPSATERSRTRHEAAEVRGETRDFAAEPLEEADSATAPGTATDPHPAPAGVPGRGNGHSKAVGHRHAGPHAVDGAQPDPAAGSLDAPVPGTRPSPETAADPLVPEQAASPSGRSAKGNPQASPDRPAAAAARPSGPDVAGSRQAASATATLDATSGHRPAAASAPRPADPSTASQPATPAAAADALAAADKPARHATAAAKGDAPAHGAREATASAPVAASPAGESPGERGDAAAGAPLPPFFPAAADAARRADGAAPFATVANAAPGNPADIPPLHEQVAMRLVTLPDGAHEVALQLSPENLGNLRIDLKLSDGRMDAVLRAESPEAREALLRDVPALREALASNGITLSSFDVSLSGGNSHEQQAPRQAGGWETGQGHHPRRDGEADSAAGAFRPGRGTSQHEAAGAAGGHWIA